jgi:hypothetical protein
MKIDITLYRGDLIDKFKETPLKDITADKFKIQLDLIEKANMVVFMDNDGRYRMLKS